MVAPDRPVDDLQRPTGDHCAEAAGGLGGERDCGAFLTATGVVFVLVTHVGHHRAVADVGLRRRPALNHFHWHQQRQTHPETGINSLFVGRHAFGIPGLERQQSRALLKYLVEFVVSDPTRVYTHHWRPGDTLIWDNRALMHRARPFDYAKPRVLIGTRVAGDPASELSYYATDPGAQAGREALAAELAILRAEATDRRYAAATASA